MSDQTSELAKGFYVKELGPKTPSWVKTKISVKADQAIELINQFKNNAGYLNLEVRESKEGKLYMVVDTWQPGAEDAP